MITGGTKTPDRNPARCSASQLPLPPLIHRLCRHLATSPSGRPAGRVAAEDVSEASDVQPELVHYRSPAPEEPKWGIRQGTPGVSQLAILNPTFPKNVTP